MENKKAQVTVFIILAIAIVVVVVLIFIGREGFGIFTIEGPPIEEIKKCMEDSVEGGMDILSLQGGSINPENYYLYQENKVEYICYTGEYYEKCVMQKPLLRQAIEEELEIYIKPEVEKCVNDIEDSLRKKGYSVSSKEAQISVELIPNNILISLEDINLVIAKDTTESYKNIKAELNSKFYSLVMIATSIANWEARYGDSESMNYMMFYPSLKVEKKEQGEGSTIYILTNRKTLDKFIFASRSAVDPPGITGN